MHGEEEIGGRAVQHQPRDVERRANARRPRVARVGDEAVRPPWQRPENGYIVTAGKNTSVYYEPHCVYDAGFLRDRALRADVLITPVVKQLLPADFTLVSGQEETVLAYFMVRDVGPFYHEICKGHALDDSGGAELELECLELDVPLCNPPGGIRAPEHPLQWVG